MDRKNYYEILGISESEKALSEKEFNKVLKEKYRNLCKTWHPDKCRDENKKKEYEERFKDIAEAYTVLSDAQKRKEYDNPNSNFNFDGFDFNGGGFADFMKDFDFFGMGGSQENQIIKGQSIRIQINITLDEIFKGSKKTIKYKHYDKCPDCNGSGKTSNSTEEVCSHCSGTGKEFLQRGIWQEIRTCHHCNGQGKIIKNPCKKCHGNGIIEVESIIDIEIPKGVNHGHQFVYKEYGHAPLKCAGPKGDLLVVFNEVQDTRFKRFNDNLIFELKIPVLDAISGGECEVTTLDNTKLLVKIKQGTEDGAQIRLKGKGLPNFNDNTKYGDMIGIAKLVLPKKLNDDEIKTINNLKTSENFKNK